MPSATLRTRHLELYPPELLTASVARGIATAFPSVAHLRLTGPGALDGRVVKAGLKCLLGAGSPAREASKRKRSGKGGGKSDAAGQATAAAAPLLPCLTSIDLDSCASTDILATLCGCSQLRSLTIDLPDLSMYCFPPPPPSPDCSLSPLSRMTGLQSLALTNVPYKELSFVLPYLSGLTSLLLDRVVGCGGSLQPSLFTCLVNLQSLEVVIADLDVGGMEHLTALTHLSAGLTAEKPRGPDRRQAARPSPEPLVGPLVWPLPPRLCSLHLHGGSVDIGVLGCLQLPDCLRWVEFGEDHIDIELLPGVHTDLDGRLLPAMERALTSALRLMARARKTHLARRGSKAVRGLAGGFEGCTVEVLYCDLLLRPPAPEALRAGGGVAGLAAPPRGHMPWLEVLAEAGPANLTLNRILLGEAEMRCIAGMESLEALCLEEHTPSLPVEALPLLGSLSRLQRLELSARTLVRQAPEVVAGALKRLCAASAPRCLEVVLKHHIHEEEEEYDSDDEGGNGSEYEEDGEDMDKDEGADDRGWARDSDDGSSDGGTSGSSGGGGGRGVRERAQALLARVRGLLGGAGLAPGMVCLQIND
ncbi:hypothetical protein GPECTOR_10g1006 [Gonium pectorale]|uniref:Uncharacterized protein n=1 Tax=Gonium pectorale TaxID=33097 RepID=A0A150GQB9_GONPE|nr:hypothetical protein GPECTOR_10g1006 [Gonium pectorale]|eukprot:KXZ51984.1 hypothetical protein GPECTOR_10g1006 [Gonium pectorale]